MKLYISLSGHPPLPLYILDRRLPCVFFSPSPPNPVALARPGRVRFDPESLTGFWVPKKKWDLLTHLLRNWGIRCNLFHMFGRCSLLKLFGGVDELWINLALKKRREDSLPESPVISRSDHNAVERYVISFGNTSLAGSSKPFLDLHLISQHPHVVSRHIGLIYNGGVSRVPNLLTAIVPPNQHSCSKNSKLNQFQQYI